MISDLTVRVRIRRLWLVRLVLTITHCVCWLLPDRLAEYVIAKMTRLSVRLARYEVSNPGDYA